MPTASIQEPAAKPMWRRFADALAAPHGIEGFLPLVGGTLSLDTVKARIVDAQRRTDDSVTLSLKPNRNWRGFRAGQYVRVSLDIDGVRRSRCYSPANSERAADGLIELTVKAHPQGLVSGHLHRRAHAGMVLELSQAQGEFALPDRRPSRILLISAGSGITPVMSMLRTLLDENHPGAITFMHYARRAQDALYRAELDAIALRHPNVRILRGYSRDEGSGELQGRFGRERLERAVPDFADAETFVCGPESLIDAAHRLWTEAGIAERLHTERFAAPPSATGEAGGELRFARSERIAANDGRALLDQAEAAGLRPQSGCRMGICHTCTCRKTSGVVKDLRTGKLSGSGEEDIQLCISVPVGTVALDL